MARYAYNDNLHSQASKATAPAQGRIDEPASLGPPAHGRCRVLELTSETALTDFTMGGSVRGVTWSLNPYVGCLHACGYCYVPQTMHLERQRWGRYVAAKHNLPQVLRRELKTRPPRTVYVSTSTDPYQAPERHHRLTRRCLEILARHDWPVDVLTRSPLVLRDLDVLRRFTRVRVGLSVPTIDDAARRLVEPHAPPIGQRLRTLRRLADAGLAVYANYTPAFPPTGDYTMTHVAQAFRDAGVHWVNSTPWRRVPTFLGPLWDRLHATPWADLARFVADPQRQARLAVELAQRLKAVGLPLHAGFFNPPFDRVATYEPTSQLRLEVEATPAATHDAAPAKAVDSVLVTAHPAARRAAPAPGRQARQAGN